MKQLPLKAVTIDGSALYIPMYKSIKIKIKEPKFKLQDSYTFQGLPISIENKAGSMRRSLPGEKPKWETKMGYDYGYIRNTEAKDKEAVDVYVNRKSKGKKAPYHDIAGGELVDTLVIVIHQKQIWKTGKWHNGICPDCKKHHTECKHAYDEDKIMLGFNSKEDAIKAYLGQYDSPRFLGPVSTYTLPEFKATLKRSFGKKLPYKNGKHEHWVGIDLDGTLAKDDGWKGKNHIGEPVPKMRDRIEKLLKEGKKVKIFTARAYDKTAIKPVQDWLKLNNIPLLEITNKKDPGMVEIWDDRARRIGKNTGNLVKSFYVDLDKSYLGQPGDTFGSTAMLQENIRKNPKAVVVKSSYINPADEGYSEAYLMRYRNKIYVPKIELSKGCMKKKFTDDQIKKGFPYDEVKSMVDMKINEMYQSQKFPNETKPDFIQRKKKESIAKQSQMITGYMQKSVVVSLEDLQKGFVKAHTRKGKHIASFYTKRKKKVAEVKHKTLHRLDMSKKEADDKIALLEKAKKLHDDHINLAKDHKAEAEESKSKGSDYYEKHGRKYLVDHAIKHLDDHIKHHENKKQSHDNHIKKIEERHETEAEHWEKKREKAEAKKGEKKPDGLTFADRKEYMAWYRKQPDDIKENHKLDRKDGKLVVTMRGEEKPEKKVVVAKKEEKKPLPVKAVVVKKEELNVPSKYTDNSNMNISDIAKSKSSIREGLLILKADKKMDPDKQSSIERSIKNSMTRIDNILEGKIDKKKVVVSKEELETGKSRSEAMMGNKNAEKPGGPKEEPKKVVVKSPIFEKEKNVVIIPKEKIEDFGQKIGGARKDMWKEKYLEGKDLKELNDREILKHVTKNKIWPKPDYEEMIKNGTDPVAAYLVKKARDSMTAKISLPSHMEGKLKEFAGKYLELVEKTRDALSSVKTVEDLKGSFDKIFGDERKEGKWSVSGRDPSKVYFATNNFIKKLQGSKWDRIKAEKEVKKGWGLAEPWLRDVEIKEYPTNLVTMKRDDPHTFMVKGDDIKSPYFTSKESAEEWAKKRFNALKDHDIRYASLSKRNKETGEYDKETGWFATKGSLIVSDVMKTKQSVEDYLIKHYPGESKKAKGKKKPVFVRPQLRKIERTRKSHRGGKDTNTADFQKTFGFKGGEFGNWNTQADRQQSMDHAHDAMMDLSDILGIKPEEISLNNSMSIAFGARGVGFSGASAHYEPARKVINLTKMKGAGSLAHEWSHAFDDYIKKSSGGQSLKSPYATDYLAADDGDLSEESVKAFGDIVEKMNRKEMPLKQYREGLEKDVIKDTSGLKNTLDGLRKDIEKKATKEQLEHFDKKIVPEIMKGPKKDDKQVQDGKKKYEFIHKKLSDLTNVFYKDITGRNEARFKNNLKYYYNHIGYAKSSLAKGSDVRLPKISSDYKNGANQMGNMFGKKDYWPSNVEMFGRAFESYIHDKLKEKGNKSDYLVHSTSNDQYKIFADPETGVTPAPYPEGEERKTLNAAFDKFIKLFKGGQNTFPRPPKKMSKSLQKRFVIKKVS